MRKGICQFCKRDFNTKFLQAHRKKCKVLLKLAPFFEVNQKSSKQKIEKHKCGRCLENSYLLTSLQGKNYCHSCSNLTILPRSESIQLAYTFLLNAYNQLESSIHGIYDKNHFVYSILFHREQVMRKILSFVYLEPSHLHLWLKLHVLLKFLYTIGIKVTEPLQNLDSLNISPFSSLIENEVDNLIQNIRLINSLQYNEIVLVQGRSRSYDIYFTSNKYHSLSSIQVARKILKKEKIKNIFQGMDLLGLVNNSLTEYLQLDSDIAESVKYNCLVNSISSIFKWVTKTPIVRNDSFSLVFNRVIEIIEGGVNFALYFHEGIATFSHEYYDLFQEVLIQTLIPELNYHHPTPQDSLDPEEIIHKFFSYFSDINSYHLSIFDNGNDAGYTIGIETLRFFQKILKYSGKSWVKKNPKSGRGRGVRLEKEIFHLTSHLQVINLFSDHRPMLNVYPNDDRKKGEIADVTFLFNNCLEIVQIKTDMALNNLRMAKYIKKLRQDQKALIMDYKNRGLSFQTSNLNLIIPVSLSFEKDVKIFLNPLHFFEYYAEKAGLRNWGGKNYFDKFPILAKMGWSTKFPLIDLEPLVKDEGLYLLQGCFQEDGSFYTGSDFDIYLLPIEEPLISNYCVLIWNESDKVISDILWLPPYYEEGFEPSTDSRKYNESSHGQRFLRIAILVGVFGYCQNCFFIPLIPSGGLYKCYRDSIKVLCPICGFSKSLSKFDSCMFPPESEELRENIINSLNRERSIL